MAFADHCRWMKRSGALTGDVFSEHAGPFSRRRARGNVTTVPCDNAEALIRRPLWAQVWRCSPAALSHFCSPTSRAVPARWERDRTATAADVDRHFALLRGAIERHGGVLFKVVGDAGQAAFPSAPEAVAAAAEAQRALLDASWSPLCGPLHVRMALHAGEAVPRDGDYLAAPLNRLARLLAAGHGTQILLTAVVERLVAENLPAGTSLRPLGSHHLRDLLEPQAVFQLVAPGLPDRFPPLRWCVRAPDESAASTHCPHWSGRGPGGGAAAPGHRGRPAHYADRPGRHGQDAARHRHRGSRPRPLPGWRLLRRSGRPDRSHPCRCPRWPARSACGRSGTSLCWRRLSSSSPRSACSWCSTTANTCWRRGAIVAALLAASPELAVLATSRAALHLRGGTRLSPRSSPCARDGAGSGCRGLARVPAVALFVALATASQPNFMLTPDNAAGSGGDLPAPGRVAAGHRTRRGAGRRLCPPRRSWRVCDSVALLVSGGRDCPRGSAPCATPSPGATTCSPRRSKPCFVGMRSSREASRSRRPRR